MLVFDGTIKALSNERLKAIEVHTQSDVLFYYGLIHDSYLKYFRDFIEDLHKDPSEGQASKPKNARTLSIILRTNGGSAQAAEKMVEMTRHYYGSINFIVPDRAMSAGTIFCMSGNRILMDYSSSLGPIDPQVYNGKTWVPAMGYLDQVERILAKSEAGNPLTAAEIVLLQKIDLAELSHYEQARNLTITLLKKWLVEYKFADWIKHESTPELIGQEVTLEQKQARAEEIATLLGNHKHWHSHGRYIGMETLKQHLRLKIEDFGADLILSSAIRDYNDLLVEYLERTEQSLFLHSRANFNI